MSRGDAITGNDFTNSSPMSAQIAWGGVNNSGWNVISNTFNCAIASGACTYGGGIGSIRYSNLPASAMKISNGASGNHTQLPNLSPSCLHACRNVPGISCHRR
jgi:hypothetical protein